MPSSEVRDAVAAALPGLLHYATVLTGDAATAEDLVQDTVVRALERAESFRGDASVATWLHRILHNLAMDRFRRPGELADSDLVATATEARWRDSAYTVDAAVVVERSAERELLRDALVHLPAIYREAVVLHDLEEMTVAHIAEIQGVELPAAKQRLRRGRMMLISKLADATTVEADRSAPALRCWDARSRISDYLDDDLTPADRTLVERHLESCPTCPPLYTAIVGVLTKVGGLRDPDTVIDPVLRERLMPTLSS